MKTRDALLPLVLIAGCAQPHNDARPTELRDPVPNYRRWPDGVGQGGLPDGDAGFRALAELGYTTAINVDGAPPGPAAARAGLRVVHVPIGYAGIEDDQALRIVRAAQLSEGPVYVHCHHGKHRGPAAAMLVRIALHGLSTEQGSADLRLSGCSPHYQGLYATVAGFERPSASALSAVDPSALVSRVAPSNVLESMLDLDEFVERLRVHGAADWRPSAEHPDATPAHDALLLREGLRELGRLQTDREGDAQYETFLSSAEDAAAALERELRASSRADTADEALRQVGVACTACHESFRDR